MFISVATGTESCSSFPLTYFERNRVRSVRNLSVIGEFRGEMRETQRTVARRLSSSPIPALIAIITLRGSGRDNYLLVRRKTIGLVNKFLQIWLLCYLNENINRKHRVQTHFMFKQFDNGARVVATVYALSTPTTKCYVIGKFEGPSRSCPPTRKPPIRDNNLKQWVFHLDYLILSNYAWFIPVLAKNLEPKRILTSHFVSI